MKKMTFIFITLAAQASFGGFSDNARFRVQIIDEFDGAPLNGMKIVGSFTERYPRWKDAVVDNDFRGPTDKMGQYSAAGKTNVGEAGFRVRGNEGYYDSPWIRIPYDAKQGSSSFPVQWWQPDDLVVTVSIQRVEHPIPLFVKRVELRDNKNGIGGFDGTNSVLRFDLKKGEWLPPYGNGEVADVCIKSQVRLTGTERRFLPQEGKWGESQFYDLFNKVELKDCDYLLPSVAKKNAGIRIRLAEENSVGRSVNLMVGKRKKIAPNKDWYCERFNDRDPNRCYTFRIRSRRNDEGKLVEAYYGKIYGDFEFEGDDKKGLIGVKFLYYLNPTSLDRNLEWDMKNNLCPNGNVGLRQP